MNANRYGDLVGGQGGGHNFLKLVGQPAIQIAGIDGGMWLDDETFISRMGNYLVVFERHDGFSEPHPLRDLNGDRVEAGNGWACGGENYATTLQLAQRYESWGSFNGGPIPARYQRDWAIMDASRDGALLWNKDGQWEVLWPDGTIQAVGSALEARLSWLGESVIMLGHGTIWIVTRNGVNSVPLVAGSTALNKPAMNGNVVSYATNNARYVYDLFTDGTAGWTTIPVYAPELYTLSGTIHAAGSLGPAELPNEIVLDRFDRPMIALPPPTPIDPPDPPDPVPPVETKMPNLIIKTRDGKFVNCDTRDGTRHLKAMDHMGGELADGVFSIWKPIQTRGAKVGDVGGLVYFDCANFPGNTIGVPWDGVGIQAACPIRTGTAFTPLIQGDGNPKDWTMQTEPTFALTYRQDKGGGIYLETFGAFPLSVQSFEYFDAATGKKITAPFK